MKNILGTNFTPWNPNIHTCIMCLCYMSLGEHLERDWFEDALRDNLHRGYKSISKLKRYTILDIHSFISMKHFKGQYLYSIQGAEVELLKHSLLFKDTIDTPKIDSQIMMNQILTYTWSLLHSLQNYY